MEVTKKEGEKEAITNRREILTEPNWNKAEKVNVWKLQLFSNTVRGEKEKLTLSVHKDKMKSLQALKLSSK